MSAAGNAQAARGYVERLGFELVVQDAEKRPLARYFPKGASSATRNIHLLERALGACSGALLAARVGNHLVLDVDVRHGGPQRLEQLLASFGPLPATWQARTPTGGQHYWFQGVSGEMRGILVTGVEVLRGNRCITLPPSSRAGGRYEWVQHPLRTPLAEPPRWLLDAIRVPSLPTRSVPENGTDPATRERRARAYLTKFDPAISGQCGHARTFLAAQVVVRGFEVEFDAALALLLEWNRNCDPPWSEREIRRKLREALRRGRMEFGALLNSERTAA